MRFRDGDPVVRRYAHEDEVVGDGVRIGEELKLRPVDAGEGLTGGDGNGLEEALTADDPVGDAFGVEASFLEEPRERRGCGAGVWVRVAVGFFVGVERGGVGPQSLGWRHGFRLGLLVVVVVVRELYSPVGRYEPACLRTDEDGKAVSGIRGGRG